MKDDRLRIPCDDEYLHSLGLAVVAFARLEWQAVWCAEKLDPGAIRTLPSKTAGDIAICFEEMAQAAPEHELEPQLVAGAARFRELVRTRNAILHAKPGTAPDGQQRLFRNGGQWNIGTVDAASDDFTECAGVLNEVFHKWLNALEN